jgi:hypothetical protein
VAANANTKKPKTMKTQCLILAGLLVTGNAMAATWTVDTNPSRPADFRSLQAAHDAAKVAPGDVLQLMPSTLSYGELTLTKRLTLIGPGYLLNQNLSFSVAAPSAMTGAIDFSAGSDGSLVTGCDIFGNVRFLKAGDAFPNYITIKRNFIRGVVSNEAAPSSHVQILQNHITSDLYMQFNDGSSGLLVRGNYVGGSMQFQGEGNSGIISHNTTSSSLWIGGSCIAENNLAAGSVYGLNNAMIRSCWGSSIVNWDGTPTISGCVAWTPELKFADQFVGTGSLDSRWRLKTSAAVKGKGRGGVDPGHRSGPEPYVLSGLPAVPLVKGILAPSSASATSGLPITVELQVNP